MFTAVTLVQHLLFYLTRMLSKRQESLEGEITLDK